MECAHEIFSGGELMPDLPADRLSTIARASSATWKKSMPRK